MKNLGIGLGLRPDHYSDVLNGPVQVSWFEALTENYLGLEWSGTGRPLQMLEKVRERFPIVLHGVSLSIGSTDPLNLNYLKRVRSLIDHIQPEWVSDHLCWTGVDGAALHDLLPLPYTEETLAHLIPRVQKAQELLGREFLLENVSSYLDYKESEMSEAEFIRELVQRTGCKLLLDVNNIYVSSINHGFDPVSFVKTIPADAVAQIHLAGHSNQGHCLIDTHDHPVADPVWELFRKTVQLIGPRSTMIEWDAKIPEYAVLEAEAMKAKEIQVEGATHAERPTAQV